MDDALTTLLEMTRQLGRPEMGYVIIGEGNTSYRIDADTFFVKASGQGMRDISPDGFVRVNFAPILALFDSPHDDLQTLQAAFQAAKVDPTTPTRPSVEVTFHAMLLHDCNVRFIAHTHPIAVNRLMCSTRAKQFALRRTFPDEVVLCGPRSVFVPYVDPGLPLARVIRQRVSAYMNDFGEAPKVILMQNHGVIALAQTPAEALNITAMCVKAAEIFAGACAVGEPVFLSEADIAHIYKRPDEIYRRSLFTQKR